VCEINKCLWNEEVDSQATELNKQHTAQRTGIPNNRDCTSRSTVFTTSLPPLPAAVLEGGQRSPPLHSEAPPSQFHIPPSPVIETSNTGSQQIRYSRQIYHRRR
jgi:hypothetical protein